MSLDQQGYLWVSDPWIAALVIVAAVGIVIWCHHLLLGESPVESIAVPAGAEATSRLHRPDATSDGLGLSCQPTAGRWPHPGRHRRAA
jgi:hypothetical protein